MFVYFSARMQFQYYSYIVNYVQQEKINMKFFLTLHYFYRMHIIIIITRVMQTPRGRAFALLLEHSNSKINVEQTCFILLCHKNQWVGGCGEGARGQGGEGS